MFEVTKNSSMTVVRVAANARVPYISLRHGQWSGLFMTALEAICHRLKYKCIIQNVPRTGLVAENQDGVLGALARRTADVGVAALGMTQARAAHFQMVYSFFDRKYSVLIHENKLMFAAGSGATSISPLQILNLDVWVLAVCFLILISVVITIGEKRFSKERIFYMVFRLIGSTLNQLDIEPTTEKLGTAVCLLLLTWLFWSLIIMAVFSSSLPALFSVRPAKQLPFSDLKTLADSDYELLGTIQSQLLFNESASPDARLIASRMIIQDPKEHWVTNIGRMAESRHMAVIVGHEVFNEIANYSRWLTSIACRPQVIALEQASKPPVASFAFMPGSLYREPIQREYFRLLEFGLIGIMYQQGLRGAFGEFHGSEHCVPKTHEIQRNAKFGTVNLSQMDFSLKVFMIGMGVAGIALIMEVAAKNLNFFFEN